MVYLLKEPLILENFFLDILLRGYHMKMQKKQQEYEASDKGCFILNFVLSYGTEKVEVFHFFHVEFGY